MPLVAFEQAGLGGFLVAGAARRDDAGRQAAIVDGQRRVLELAQQVGGDLRPFVFGLGGAHAVTDAVAKHDHIAERTLIHQLYPR